MSAEVQESGLRLDAIVARLGGELRGEGAVRIHGVGTLAHAGPGQIAFLANPKYRGQLAACRAGAVILSPRSADEAQGPAIVTANPYAYYARVAQLLHPMVPPVVPVHPQAFVAPDAVLGEGVVIHAGCVVGPGARIGEGSILYPNVTIYHGCVVGARCIIHSGVVIGADGFGFAPDGETWVKIPQVGRVVIGDDVEIGANTTIDRGAIEDTVIGNGVKLDNQIQIAHNVVVGDHTVIAGCSAIAGSTRIGRHCIIAGAANIIGHLTIADGVQVSAGTLVGKNLTEPGVYTGVFPMTEHREWQRIGAHMRHLDDLAKRVRELEKRLEERGED